MKSGISHKFCFFVFSLSCGSIFMAHASFASQPSGLAKEEAIDMALAQAAAEEDVNKEDAKDNTTNDAYRQKLQEVITKEEEPPFAAEHYIRYMPSSRAIRQDGSVTLTETGSEYSYQFKLSDKFPVELSIRSGFIGIDNRAAVKLPAHLTDFAAGVETTFPFFNFEKTYLRVGLIPNFSTDRWNFESSSLRLDSRYFLIYQPDDKLTLIGGVSVSPGPDACVLPIAGFIYKPNDKLLFNIVPLRPSISYDLNDKLTVFTELYFNFGTYIVNKTDLPINDEGKGVALDVREASLGVGLNYKVNKNISSYFQVGGAFNRQLKYQESYGKVNLKNNFFSEFGIEIKM